VARIETNDRVPYQLLAPAPRAKNRRTAARQQAAIGRSVEAFQEILDRLDPEQLDDLATQIRDALEAPPTDQAQVAFIRELAGGRDYTPDERISLRLQTLLRTFRQREVLLRDALTAPEVARLLHVSRQTPHDRLASGAFLAARDRGMLRFPSWQFDPDGPNGVVVGLPAISRALELSEVAKINWFVQPNPYLDGCRPIDVLKQGEVERVLDAAQTTGPR
jgi:hypothetical protein